MKASFGLMLARAILVCGAAVAGGSYFATQKPAVSHAEKAVKEKPVHKSVKGEEGEEREEEPAKRPAPQQATIREAIAQLLKNEGGQLFPKGTRVVGVNLKEGLATLDFSEEFKQIETMGESTESEAQKAIIGALVRFPVEKARVVVEGKPYSSAAVDWSQPFAVQ